MKLPPIFNGTRWPALLLACGLACAGAAQAQQSPKGPPPASEQQQAKPGSVPATPPAPAGQPEPPKINPQEDADYKTFYDTQDPDKKIHLGQNFLQEYPGSRYTEATYDQLANAYYAKADWNNFYAVADKAIALDPKDVDMLVLEGCVIPHFYDPNDPGARKKLDKAEDYENRAILIIPNMSNPGGVSDAQFAAAKAGLLAQAHSGLGMIAFQRGNYEDCIKELSQAAQGIASPDSTDLYVVGMALEKLKRYGDAADSFGRCAQIPGSVRDKCKQGAERMRAQSGQVK
jgi:tetratricopeptide (TPR) repeat protein